MSSNVSSRVGYVSSRVGCDWVGRVLVVGPGLNPWSPYSP